MNALICLLLLLCLPKLNGIEFPVNERVGCKLNCPRILRCWKDRLGERCVPPYPTCSRPCPSGTVCQLFQPYCSAGVCLPVPICVNQRQTRCSRIQCPSSQVCIISPSNVYCETPY